MEDIIKDLKQIRKDLLFAVEYRDGLLVKFQVNKIDTLINRLSKKLNEGIVNEANPKFHNSGCYQPTVDNTKLPPPKGGSGVK